MHTTRPLALLLTFALSLLLTRGMTIRVVNDETRDEQGALRAPNVMMLIGISNNINIHHAKVAHDHAPQRP